VDILKQNAVVFKRASDALSQWAGPPTGLCTAPCPEQHTGHQERGCRQCVPWPTETKRRIATPLLQEQK
jgi:hypothetical protein